MKSLAAIPQKVRSKLRGIEPVANEKAKRRGTNNMKNKLLLTTLLLALPAAPMSFQSLENYRCETSNDWE
jgi:hypothetical protein